MTATKNPRIALDRLFQLDSILSMASGIIGITVPHFCIVYFVGDYNHNVHEALRLYACLRLALGWMLWNVRSVDDGVLRRRICESLMGSNALQSLIVLRAQLTGDTMYSMNWIVWLILVVQTFLYGRFRFGKGGNLIKIYELPTSASLR